MNDLSLAVTGTLIAGVPSDILVAGSRITSIEPHDPSRVLPAGVRVLDGTHTHALPGLMNTHTHSAMVLLRSFADDMPLMPWLQEKIWPLEARLTADDVYWGTRLACVEMIRSGTTFFNDMYWHADAVARAARDSGMRALVASVFIDLGDAQRAAAARRAAEAAWEARDAFGPRVRCALGPHAIYTVGDDSLRWIAAFSERHDVLVHAHVAETAFETAECRRQHGVSPVRHLERLGLLSPRLLAAHSVHLDDDDIARYARHGVHALHNPASNLKLASGGPMRYAALRAAGVNVTVGTDGCASNNNLDLLEELKFAALLAKHATLDPTTLPAAEALQLVTAHAARAVRVDAGELAVGRLADLVLVDAHHLGLFPGHDLAADLIHSAHGDCVVASVIDGQVVMEGGVVPDEREIRAEVRARLARLLNA